MDDNASIRNGLKKLLKKADYDACVAADGLEAVERFFAEEFDLLILDLDMPRKDGWAAAENITRLKPFVPIIIMTGMPNQRAIASAAGMSAIFEKPFDPEDMIETIGVLLDEPRSNHWLRRRSWLPDVQRIPKTKFVSSRGFGRGMIPSRSSCALPASAGRLVAAD